VDVAAVKSPGSGIGVQPRLFWVCENKEMRAGVTVALSLLLIAGPVLAAAEKVQNSVGIVREYSAASHTFSVEDESGRTIRFVWAKETKFNGVVSAGEKVTVRYTEEGEGRNVALTVGVLK